MNVLEGGFSITSQMNNAIYNHGGAFNGNNISFSASTGSSGSGAALKLAIGTVIGLNASVINDRSKPAVEVESGSVEITGGSYPANGSPDGALYVGGTVTLKGGTFSNTSFLSKAISVGTNITYASLLEKGCGYTADNGTTFLTDENAIGAATSLTVKAVPAPSAHTHAVSVGCETDSGAQVEFQPLPDMSASNSSGYTLAGGSYYLTANAAVGGSLTINGNVTLCLNGYTLSFSGGTEIEGNASAAISVPRGSSLSVCDCGQSKGKIAYQAGGPRGHAAIGGAGDVTLYGCAVEISKTSDYVANGLYNAGGIFTLYDSHVSATHTISGSDKTPFATAIDGRPGSTTFIHGGSLSATVRNGTAYTDGNSGAYGLNLNNGSTAYLLGRPTITASNDTGTNNFAGVYVPSSSAQLWLSKDGEAYSGNALTIKVSKHNYSEGGTVVLGVGENGDNHTIKNAPNGFAGTVIETEGRKDLVLTGPYTVTFNANGGEGTMADQSFDGWTDSKAFTANGFTGADGASFQSWNTKQDGSGTSYADGATVSGLAYGGTVTLYAQWGAAEGHTHVWDTGWTNNDTYHWHKCIAEGCDITDYTLSQFGLYTCYAPHAYDNDQDTTCDTCGYTRTLDASGTEGKVETSNGAPDVSTSTEVLKELAGTPQPGETITVKLTVAKKDNAEGKSDIETLITGGKRDDVLYLDLSLLKIVSGGTSPGNTPITDTQDKVLEIVVPYSFSGKKDVKVYRYHNGTAQTLTEADTRDDGTYKLGTNSIIIYASKFSTYAIAYTPIGGGGGGGGGYVPPAYPVELPASTSGGSITASHKSASSGTTVTLTLAPDGGYEIGGVTVADQNGKTVALTGKGDGTYTFTMPSGKVTVKAEFTKSKDSCVSCPRDDTCPIRRFSDADPAAWYHDGVHYCVENGLMDGYGGGLLGPDRDLSRAEFVQMLHNLEGKPVVNYLMGFEDIHGGAWYTEAVRWAASRRIAGGYGGGRFGPKDAISREELAVMLWRYAGCPAATDKELSFADVDKAGGWTLEALRWAVGQGILRGKEGGMLDPKGMTTRAEAAAMLQRFCGNVM